MEAYLYRKQYSSFLPAYYTASARIGGVANRLGLVRNNYLRVGKTFHGISMRKFIVFLPIAAAFVIALSALFASATSQAGTIIYHGALIPQKSCDYNRTPHEYYCICVCDDGQEI
jgi:hypothetical protein